MKVTVNRKKWRLAMNFKERDFIPMLFGGDINTYSVARAFMNVIK